MKIRETDYGRFTSQEIIEASFQEWIEFVFSKNETERNWISGDDFPNWSLPRATTLEYIEQTFLNSESVFADFSNSQISNGLNFIHNGSFSDTVYLFADRNISIEARLSSLKSVGSLYSGCFAKRCDNVQSNWNEVNNPLNGVCYMWWDVFAIHGKCDSKEDELINDACLSVMKEVLDINHVACQESALHGLGHWQMYYPEKISTLIHNFLESHHDLDVKLRRYAMSAAQGCVQ